MLRQTWISKCLGKRPKVRGSVFFYCTRDKKNKSEKLKSETTETGIKALQTWFFISLEYKKKWRMRQGGNGGKEKGRERPYIHHLNNLLNNLPNWKEKIQMAGLLYPASDNNESRGSSLAKHKLLMRTWKIIYINYYFGTIKTMPAVKFETAAIFYN